MTYKQNNSHTIIIVFSKSNGGQWSITIIHQQLTSFIWQVPRHFWDTSKVFNWFLTDSAATHCTSQVCQAIVNCLNTNYQHARENLSTPGMDNEYPWLGTSWECCIFICQKKGPSDRHSNTLATHPQHVTWHDTGMAWYSRTTLIGPPCALVNGESRSWKGPLAVWGAIYAMYGMYSSVTLYGCTYVTAPSTVHSMYYPQILKAGQVLLWKSIFGEASFGTSIAKVCFPKKSCVCRKPFAQPRSSTTRKERAVFRWTKSYCLKEVKRGLLRTPNWILWDVN